MAEDSRKAAKVPESQRIPGNAEANAGATAGSGERHGWAGRMVRSVKIDFDSGYLFSGQELRAVVAQKGGGARYGFLEEVVVRGDGSYPGPDQTKPGLPGDRGGLGIGLFDLGRLFVSGPGPVPAPPGHKQPGRLQMRHEHGGTGGEHEDEDAGECTEDGAPVRIRPGRIRVNTV